MHRQTQIFGIMVNLRVKEFLSENGITQRDLAERMGISPSVLSKRLNGDISLRELSEIADALGVPYVKLVADPDETEGEVTCPQCGEKIRLTFINK